MSTTDPADTDPGVADDVLVGRLAAGRPEACAELYRRHAGTIFGIAAQSLDAAAAEDVVQDVFAVVWRKAATYDPARGAVRAWILQIAHTRILNELRRRSRRPAAPEPEENGLDGLPGAHAAPDETAWRDHRRRAVRAAVDALPPAQRQALRVAFFDELTREQAAEFLGLPVGTVKTRVRAALTSLRVALVPYAVAVALAAAGGVAAVRGGRARDEADQRERALRLVASSDVVPLRLTAVGATPQETHATYRGRPGTAVAVITFSHFAPPPEGRVYVAWARRAGRWTPLGAAPLDGSGAALVIVEGPDVATAPDALEVTVEPSAAGDAPTGEPVVRWTAAGR
jgi:RNA polymerase sigma-70 factor (ECF subfamily)